MKPIFLFLYTAALFVWGYCDAQITKKPANNNAKPVTKPATSNSCYQYFPVKAGSTFRYLKSSRTVNNPAVTAYELTETYYPANPRTIAGKSCTSYLKDQRLNFVASDINSLFRINSLNRTDRVYFNCTTDKDGTRFMELQEVLQQNSKITGYYTEVTESYRSRSSIVPNSVTYDDLPLVEIERLGTGVFNTNYIYSSNRNNEQYWWTNQEIRQDRAESSSENPYEYKEFYFGEEIDSMEVQGKNYKNVLAFGTYIYKSAKEKPENPQPVALEQTYYAAGVGLILKFRIEKSGLGYYNSSIEQGLNRMFSGKGNDRSENITVWELLPDGMAAKEGLKKQLMIDEGEKIKKTIDAFFQ